MTTSPLKNLSPAVTSKKSLRTAFILLHFHITPEYNIYRRERERDILFLSVRDPLVHGCYIHGAFVQRGAFPMRRGLISEDRCGRERSLSANPYRGSHPPRLKDDVWNRESHTVSCKMQIGCRHGRMRARAHIRPHQPCNICITGKGRERGSERYREREGCCVETAVVGCIATAVASAGSVTGDSYAVDITIMECVRLPLCLSLYIHPNRLLLSRYLVSYNRPSRSIMTLFSLVFPD